MGGFIAARMWWMLRSIGHESSRVLNGDFGAWLDTGLEVEAGANTPDSVHYPAPEDFNGVVAFDELAGRTLLDARAPERYRGDEEPVDPKAGHIPGALSKPAADNLQPSGVMKSPEDLSDLYVGLDGAVTSCGSGVTACHDALAMVVSGMEMPDIYIGSFSDWSRRDLPVARGAEP